MKGKGCTRIDLVLATPSAKHMIIDMQHMWHYNGHDHVPTQIVLNTSSLDDLVWTPVVPSPLPIQNLKPTDIDDTTKQRALQSSLNTYRTHLLSLMANEDLDGAHTAWSDLAQTYLE